MERKMRKLRNNSDIVRLMRYREVYAECSSFVGQQCQFNENFIKRLNLEYELEGHQGCVNCLEWSSDGKHLASGSDDTNVIYWDPFHHKKLQVIPTPHIGNIFSIKFLDTNDSIIATAAGDCKIIVQDVNEAVSRNTPILNCSCHIARVKRLATCPDQLMLFWSAGEDGMVLQYDLRDHHECRNHSNVFIDLNYGSEIKCIQVNPTKPNYIAVGANDCFVRVYDRRKIKVTPDEKLRTSQPFKSLRRSPPALDPNCVQYYSPAHLAKEHYNITSFKLAATYIAFNANGTEMLVNMGGEQIYLFDVNEGKPVNEIMVPQKLVQKEGLLKRQCCESPVTTSKKRDRTTTVETPVCLCDYLRRADMLFERNWMGDMYAAARDYIFIIQHNPEEETAYLGLIKCFIHLKWPQEAFNWTNYILKKFPHVKRWEEVLNNLSTIREMIVLPGEEDVAKVEPQERLLRQNCLDYKRRFLGHCNTTTDIKEVNFLGQQGNYICAGSDEGIIFIWDKHSAEIVTALWGDISIVNCIQPHPSVCFIASSGIDPAVKLWSPSREDNSKDPRVVQDLPTLIEDNQQKMAIDPFQSMVANINYRFASEYPGGQPQDIPNCRTS